MQALAPNVDAYFRAVLVFTCAWVDADFGKTGKAHCVRDDRLKRYLEDGKRGKSLSADQVEVLARAFAGLAQMEPEFTAQMGFRPGEEVVAGRQVGSLGNGSHVAESLDGCAVSAGGRVGPGPGVRRVTEEGGGAEKSGEKLRCKGNPVRGKAKVEWSDVAACSVGPPAPTCEGSLRAWHR